MKEVNLYTADGKYVCTAIVPVYQTGDPEVLIWGSRVFQFKFGKYMETFASVVLQHKFADGAKDLEFTPVYNREECVFNYCPSPDTCKKENKCCNG